MKLEAYLKDLTRKQLVGLLVYIWAVNGGLTIEDVIEWRKGEGLPAQPQKET